LSPLNDYTGVGGYNSFESNVQAERISGTPESCVASRMTVCCTLLKFVFPYDDNSDRAVRTT
jgi:hypothetical protein